MTISPGKYDITIYQGATFSQQFTWKDQAGTPINLTGYTARMMARTSIDAPAAFLTLNTANGGIALGGAAGTITLNLSDAQTAAISVMQGVYDLELIDSLAKVIRLLEGSVVISPEVTR
jgi:hypothetical protein